jgi:peptidoglycan/LPS O-acetylase OafA/YrhL
MKPRDAFRSEIEGLRGIAVLIVVAFHCRIPEFSGGFVGVDVFFVLSGYLITGLLVAEIRRTSTLSLLNFYARRARRLLPACALALAVTILAGELILAPNELASAGRAARATALYLSNVFFATNAADYFARDVETNPLLHTWSLAVEEQFYLFWPLLILLAFQLQKSRKWFGAILWALTLLSFATCVWLTNHKPTSAFYGLPARAWEFGIGGLAVQLPVGALKLSRPGWLTVQFVGLLAILASAHFIGGDAGFPGWIALAPVLGTVVALIAGAEQPHAGAGKFLDWAPMQFLGTLSYSWYLWHWPFLVLSAALFPNMTVAGKIAAAILSLLMATVTHKLIENPIRFHPALVQRPVRSLYMAGMVTLFSLGIAFLCMRLANRLAHVPGMQAIMAAADDISSLPREQCVSLGESGEVKSCVFGNQSSATNVVLFGDSHAVQWFDPLRRIAESHGWRLTTILKSACPAADITRHDAGSGLRENCAEWRENAIRQIAALHPSIVVEASATVYLRRGEAGSRLDVSLDEWRAGTRRTLESLSAASIEVVQMRDTPRPFFDVPTCLARSLRHAWYPGGSCEVMRSNAVNSAAFEVEQAAARGLPNVHFIDLTNRLCGEKVCPTVDNGVVMYRDDNHLTGRFAETLAPALEADLLPLLKR